MPRDSNGNYLRPSNSFSNPAPQTPINSTDADALFDDFETALNNSAVKNAEFVVTTATTMLPNERVLTAGAGVSIATTATAVTITADASSEPELTALASLTSAADQVPYFTGPGTATTATLSAFGRAIIDDNDAASVRDTIGAQTLDPDLTSLAGAAASGGGPSPSGLFYRKSAGTWAPLNLVNLTIDTASDTITGSGGGGGGGNVSNSGPITADNLAQWVDGTHIRSLPIGATMTLAGGELNTTAGGGNVMATTSPAPATGQFARWTSAVQIEGVSGAALTPLSSLTPATDTIPYFNGATTAATTPFTAVARTLLDDTTTAAMLATLGAQPLDPDLTSLAGAGAFGGGPTPSGLYYRRALNDWQPLNLSGLTLDVGTNTLLLSTSISAAPADALAYNGMQINGSMEVSQERGTLSPVASGYIMDGWSLANASTAVLGGSQLPVSTNGFNYMLGVGVTTATGSFAAGAFCAVVTLIEGYRVSRLAWGAAGAQPITIGFWTAHHRTGLYTGAVRSGDNNRSYVFSYTQNASDVIEYKTVTIPGCVDGTWYKDNRTGLMVIFSMGSGTTYTAPSLNTWFSATYLSGPGQVNAVAATSDVFRLTGVIVLPGTQTPSAAQSPLIMRPYDQELQICKRHWQLNYATARFLATAAGATFEHTFALEVEMRSAPTATAGAPSGGSANLFAGFPNVSTMNAKAGRFAIASAAAGDCYALLTPVTCDARLV